jgi:hypothetical protein
MPGVLIHGDMLAHFDKIGHRVTGDRGAGWSRVPRWDFGPGLDRRRLALASSLTIQ